MKHHFANLEPAKYFPVSKRAFTMSAGIHHLGTDFGNGKQDQLFFQRDRYFDKYQALKKSISLDRHWAFHENEKHRTLHKHAIKWIIDKQLEELDFKPLAKLLDSQNTLDHLEETYFELSLNIQEDIALITNEPASLIMGNISMPSFWDPKRIRGASFWQIHEPVPNFPKDQQMGDRLVELISSKGPYVRFVWTVSNDAELDHHPENGRIDWQSNQDLYFRVERQVTVPFSGLGALFLIRTYIYPFESLTKEQCEILAYAIRTMPDDSLVYKGLKDGYDIIISVLKELT